MATPLRAARRMRRGATFNERVLWKLLRDRRLEGLKFRRQVPIGPYVVDFICFAQRLIVEADGPMHDAERDGARDAWLRGQRFHVLRFPNAQITLHPDRVLDEIRSAAGIEPYPSSGASRHLLPQGEKDDAAAGANVFLARAAS